MYSHARGLVLVACELVIQALRIERRLHERVRLQEAPDRLVVDAPAHVQAGLLARPPAFGRRVRHS